MELWMEEVMCWYCPYKFLWLAIITYNYNWKRLFVGIAPANICHWPRTMNGKGYVLVLSLQIFVIGHWGYVLVLALQIFVIDHYNL